MFLWSEYIINQHILFCNIFFARNKDLFFFARNKDFSLEIWYNNINLVGKKGRGIYGFYF